MDCILSLLIVYIVGYINNMNNTKQKKSVLFALLNYTARYVF